MKCKRSRRNVKAMLVEFNTGCLSTCHQHVTSGGTQARAPGPIPCSGLESILRAVLQPLVGPRSLANHSPVSLLYFQSWHLSALQAHNLVCGEQLPSCHTRILCSDNMLLQLGLLFFVGCRLGDSDPHLPLDTEM